MNGWTEVRLGRGLRVHHGYAFKGEFFSAEGTQIVLTPGNFVEHGGFKPKTGTEKYYRGPVPEKFLLKKGDVVIAMTEQAQGLLGSSATIPEDGTYLHNQRIGLLEVTDPQLLDLRFVYHLMNSPDVRRQIQATATGSKVRHTAPERVQAVTTRVPAVPQQQTVAEILDTLEWLIQNNRRRVEVLEEMARAVYREWFVKFRYPGYEDATLVESILGPIPKEWVIDPFDEIASFENGFAFKPSHWGLEGRPIIKIKELKQGVSVATPRCPAGDIDKKFWVEAGDLLMSWSADLGAYRWGGEPGLLNQHLFAVRPKGDSVSLAYLRHALDNAMPSFQARAQGTTMKHIKRAALHEVSAVVPPLVLVRRFDEVVGPIDDEVLSLQKLERELTAMRGLLLPRMVAGQIDVSRLDLGALLKGRVA